MSDLSHLNVPKKKKTERDSKDKDVNKGLPPKKVKGKASISNNKKEGELPVTKSMILNGDVYSEGTKLLIDELKKQRDCSKGIIQTKDQMIRQMEKQILKER